MIQENKDRNPTSAKLANAAPLSPSMIQENKRIETRLGPDRQWPLAKSPSMIQGTKDRNLSQPRGNDEVYRTSPSMIQGQGSKIHRGVVNGAVSTGRPA